MTYFCSQKNRRALVLDHPTLNGIDYLEVCTTEPGCDCGKLLNLTFLKDARPLNLAAAQIKIIGGASLLTQVKIVNLSTISTDNPRVLTIELDAAGDFSTYTLSLVANDATTDPPDGIDPQLAVIDFSFKANCPTVSDCLPTNCCPPNQHPEPDINYLAKDYEGFRQVMIDRLAVLTPDWNEPNPPDTGVALVEVLAYLADHLSYQQDAVGTEAYLGTARSRISMRRHAKLVDYQISAGCNSRTWVYLKVSSFGLSLPLGTRLFPRIPGLPSSIQTTSASARLLTDNGALAFATMQHASLYEEQNEIHVYTWSDTGCCLAPGATQATLVGTLQSLQPGSVLLFEEVLGPQTGDPQDADTTKRWAVRLAAVQTLDFQNRVLVDPLNGEPITLIWWTTEDALPFNPTSAASTLLASSSSTPHLTPQLHVQDDQSLDWPIARDLLSTSAIKRASVVEIENDGTAFLRFGDGQYGMAAETGTAFSARYRIGNGAAGNIGRDTLGHILTDIPGILQIRNPLAAAGGTDPESMTHIRQQAPFAFRSQLRAVTENDYAVMTKLDPAIFEARGTLRWTGSWYTAFVSVDADPQPAPAPHSSRQRRSV